MDSNIIILSILNIVTLTAAAPISVFITNMNSQGVIILMHIDGNVIVLFILDPFIVIFIISVISVLPVLGVNNDNTVASFVLNATTPIITHSKGDTVIISIFNMVTVLPNTSTYNDTNIDSKTVIISMLKIVIPVVNILIKSYKCKTVILSAIIIVINSTLITLLKNCKCKIIEIIIIINIFFTNSDIVILFILNFNLKVSAIFLLKKHK